MFHIALAKLMKQLHKIVPLIKFNSVTSELFPFFIVLNIGIIREYNLKKLFLLATEGYEN